MQRVHHNTANLTLPPLVPVSGAPGFFREGTAILPPTFVTGNWANGIQEELIYIIQQGGLVPDINVNTQVWDALQGYIDTGDAGNQPLDGDLTSLSALTGTGIVARTAADTYQLRSITTNTTLTVTNGNGVAGNPLLGMAAIAQIGGGSFSKFFVNGFGQVTHNTPVTAGDIFALTGPFPPPTTFPAGALLFIPVFNATQIHVFSDSNVPQSTLQIGFTTVTVPSVPATCDFVLLRVRTNGNMEENNGVSANFRPSSAFGAQTKISSDPILGGGNYEFDGFATFVMPITASNTFQYELTKGNGPPNGDWQDISIRIWLEGYFVPPS